MDRHDFKCLFRLMGLLALAAPFAMVHAGPPAGSAGGSVGGGGSAGSSGGSRSGIIKRVESGRVPSGGRVYRAGSDSRGDQGGVDDRTPGSDAPDRIPPRTYYRPSDRAHSDAWRDHRDVDDRHFPERRPYWVRPGYDHHGPNDRYDEYPPYYYYYYPPYYYNYPMPVYVYDSPFFNDDLSGDASYEVVERDGREWVEGHFAEIPEEEPIDGEYVEVYHPAVFREDESGKLQQVEDEKTTREPKVRIVLRKRWIEGHYADEPPPAPVEKSSDDDKTDD